MDKIDDALFASAKTDIGLCSLALRMLERPIISSFDVGSAEAEVARNLYEPIRDTVLSLSQWTFATKKHLLIRSTVPPEDGFDYAYKLPTDFLQVIQLGSCCPTCHQPSKYQVNSNNTVIFSNAAVGTLTYIGRIREENFPPYFKKALVAELASQFCVPLTENAELEKVLQQNASRAFKWATLTDSGYLDQLQQEENRRDYQYDWKQYPQS